MIKNQPSCQDIVEAGLLPVETAREKILSSIRSVTGSQCVGIDQARGRILACDLISPIHVPAHTNSAVDGYALNSKDLAAPAQTVRLEVAGRALAGQAYTGTLTTGQCIHIMTGAPLPDSVDTVVMQEQVERTGNFITVSVSQKPGQNIRQCGEDLQQGQQALHQGKLLTPPDIGLIASLGITEIDVTRNLRVALASTGNEIYAAGTQPEPGGIYDSNRHSLSAALQRPGIDIIDLGILSDDPDSLSHTFKEAADCADMIISSGGVSVGQADFTRDALQGAGKIGFWKIAIKPGRPLAYGQIGNAAFFGLPGNPVAVMVTFYLFVLPALEKMLGVADQPVIPFVKACAAEDIRKKSGRTEIPRGILYQQGDGTWWVKTTGKQGSGILKSMSTANAFIVLEPERSTIRAGESITVLPFSALF